MRLVRTHKYMPSPTYAWVMFQVVRRWIMKEDLLVKLVYLSTGWVHDGRNKDTYILGIQIGFPFLWPVYNLLHHSYIIQVKDTCIHKVGVWMVVAKEVGTQIEFHSSCLCSTHSWYQVTSFIMYSYILIGFTTHVCVWWCLCVFLHYFGNSEVSGSHHRARKVESCNSWLFAATCTWITVCCKHEM